MTTSVDHVLLTRFNVPTPGPESLIRAQEGWLRKRVALFDRFCRPSVAYQDNQDFRWIVYFDPESPSWLLEWLHDRARGGLFRPILRTRISADDLRADLRGIIPDPADALLTTNLDNDDALAADTVDRLQHAASTVLRASPSGEGAGTRRTALYLPDGLILREDLVYRRHDPRNAFCSVLEDWSEPVTCWTDWHNRLHLTMDEQVVESPAGWLQVIHDTNVSNRVQGRLASPNGARTRFPGLLDDVADPGRTALGLDIAVGRPLRAARETTRGVAKKAVLALVGTEGLTAAKHRLEQWKHPRWRLRAGSWPVTRLVTAPTEPVPDPREQRR